MGQARKEEDEEEEEEAVTAREAGPELVSPAGNLTAINLINVQQQFPRRQPPPRFLGTGMSTSTSVSASF